MTVENVAARARGTLLVHSCSRSMTAPVEWVVSDLLGHAVKLDWRPQPLLAGAVRTDLDWYGALGTAAKLASALRGLPQLRFEVTEHFALSGHDQRISYTPALGIFRADIDVHGNVVVGEQQLRAALARCESDPAALAEELRRFLGAPWDEELEAFRVAADDDTVRWVHRVG